MKKIKWIILTALVISAVGVLVACGTRDNNDNNNDKVTEDTSTLGNGIKDAGSEINNAGDNIIEGAAGAGEDVLDAVEDVGDGVVDGVEDIGNDMNNDGNNNNSNNTNGNNTNDNNTTDKAVNDARNAEKNNSGNVNSVTNGNQ